MTALSILRAWYITRLGDYRCMKNSKCVDNRYHIDWDTVWEQFDRWYDWYCNYNQRMPRAVEAAMKMQELVEAQLQQQRSA